MTTTHLGIRPLPPLEEDPLTLMEPAQSREDLGVRMSGAVQPMAAQPSSDRVPQLGLQQQLDEGRGKDHESITQRRSPYFFQIATTGHGLLATRSPRREAAVAPRGHGGPGS